MRRNVFDEAYCHSASELLDELDRKDRMPTDVYAPSVEEDGTLEPHEPSERRWSAEIADNVDGDTICHVEAATQAQVEAILKEAGVELQS